MIECACVVCHGPVEYRGRVTAACCSENCHRYWHDALKHGAPLGSKYQIMRVTQAYRRDQIAFLARVEALLVQSASRKAVTA